MSIYKGVILHHRVQLSETIRMNNNEGEKKRVQTQMWQHKARTYRQK